MTTNLSTRTRAWLTITFLFAGIGAQVGVFVLALMTVPGSIWTTVLGGFVGIGVGLCTICIANFWPRRQR